MKNRLKSLYKYLVENRKHEIIGWHDDYRDFYGQVGQIRKRIQAGESVSQGDTTFLKKLLYEKSNGIASRGQSTLSELDFKKVIQDSEYLEALQNLIKDATRGSYKNFTEIWPKKVSKNNPVLINRVAAACTLKASTTVDSGRFNEVFSWLIREKIIPAYPSEEDQDWFSKNEFLMEQIKSSDWLEEKFNNEALGYKTYQIKDSDIETDEFFLSMFVWYIYENLSNPFSLKKQIVKYGAPGTGKTYKAREQTELLFDVWKEEFAPDSSLTHESQIELVQFHPSFSYEDFIEGLRPVLDGNGTAQLTLQNGVFKRFCSEAGKWEIDVYGLSLDRDWESLTIEELRPHREKLSGSYWQHIFEMSAPTKLVSDAVPPFFFIIDEVNRAELSRVFGELMYCLEYRGVEGAVKTQYANLNSSDTAMLCVGADKNIYKFFIPTNVYLIGTMNTIDRSVESFDFALRRRFRWEEVKPDMRVLRYHLASTDEGIYKHWAPLAGNLEQLNSKITNELLLGHDYQIGHAYLMNMKYASSLTIAEVRARVWDDCIRPLLQEYLRGTGKEIEIIDSFGKAFGV